MEKIESKNINKIKYNNVLQKIFSFLHQKRLLQVIKNNKKIQNILNINIKNYKECHDIFSTIEIEIKPSNSFGQFINLNEEKKNYYHIFFNDNKEEIKNKYCLCKDDKVTKIKILMDYQIKSLSHIFWECIGIESINFKKFYRNNIEDMSDMFYDCSSLNQIKFSSFNTDNVTDMSYMFYGCSSLKKIKSF